MDTVPLRDHFNEVIMLSIKNIETRLKAMDNALTLAGREAEKQYELLNNTRRDMVPIEVYRVEHENLNNKVDKNSRSIAIGIGVALAVQALIGIILYLLKY